MNLIVFEAMSKYLKTKCFALVIGAAGLASQAWAQTQPAPSAQQPPLNNVAQAAAKQGVVSCAGRINQVSSFLGFGPEAGALLMTPPNNPDQRLVPLVMELQTPAGQAYASVSFAPNQVNGCGASYDAVVYWPAQCDAVATQQFGGLKRIGFLKKSIAVLDGGAATKVFLMPAGNGCVSIKKEVVF